MVSGAGEAGGCTMFTTVGARGMCSVADAGCELQVRAGGGCGSDVAAAEEHTIGSSRCDGAATTDCAG